MHHILIVDEEEHLLWALEKNLLPERDDLKIITANSGEEGLDLLRDKNIDVLICDIKMPGKVDGFQLILRAKEIAPDARVIIMTAFGTNRIQNLAERIGITHYIEKPFNISDLRNVVLELLDAKEGFQGVLSDLELTDIIQMLCLAKRTALLHLKHKEHRGKIVFERGDVTHAEFDDMTGEDAVYRMLALKQGDIYMQSDFTNTQRTISIGWQDLLLEGVRRADEHRAALAESEEFLLEDSEDLPPGRPPQLGNADSEEPEAMMPSFFSEEELAEINSVGSDDDLAPADEASTPASGLPPVHGSHELGDEHTSDLVFERDLAHDSEPAPELEQPGTTKPITQPSSPVPAPQQLSAQMAEIEAALALEEDSAHSVQPGAVPRSFTPHTNPVPVQPAAPQQQFTSTQPGMQPIRPSSGSHPAPQPSGSYQAPPQPGYQPRPPSALNPFDDSAPTAPNHTMPAPAQPYQPPPAESRQISGQFARPLTGVNMSVPGARTDAFAPTRQLPAITTGQMQSVPQGAGAPLGSCVNVLQDFARECQGLRTTGVFSANDGLAMEFVDGPRVQGYDGDVLSAFFLDVVASAVQTARSLIAQDFVRELQIVLEHEIVLLRAIEQTPYIHIAVISKDVRLGIAIVLMRRYGQLLSACF